MSTRQKPVGADLLRLFGPWLDGVRLEAGVCLLSDEPEPTELLGQRCPEEGCRSLICGPTDEALADNLRAHRRRCHS